MNCRPAAADDSADMLRMIESHPSGGGMKIIYTRRPDAFKSYHMECPDAEVTLCISKDDRVLAQVVCLPRRFYIDGEPQTLGYVTGLHKAKDSYINLLKLLEVAHTNSTAGQHFCSILDENKAAYNLLAKRGSILPICGYTTYIISPAALKPPRHSPKLRQATPADEDSLTAFYNDTAPGYSYFPVFEDILRLPGLSTADFHVLEEDGEIIAAGALWNQQSYKQCITLEYCGIYKIAARINPLLRMLRYPAMPKINKTANFAYISFALCRKDRPGALRALLGGLAAAGKKYDFLTIGAASVDEPDAILSKAKSIKIGSKLCVTDYHKTGKLPQYKTPPRFECGLL